MERNELNTIGYEEIGADAHSTLFRDGDELDFQKTSENVKPYGEWANEAKNHAIETPRAPEPSIWEKVGKTGLEEVIIYGERLAEVRPAEANQVEPASLAVAALKRNDEFHLPDYDLAA